eukprot:CAMPEP_0117558066 /NCGR_PEP_ID=MMETSP0784-20121206/52644_1 /TAXON_ID=39447 /ORGANISM="" /LENGTH=190 /DNA_ID=CAMNT_0005355383 /DNA_START=302 /DNA_END=874 /DNA_ORIENTATION=+
MAAQLTQEIGGVLAKTSTRVEGRHQRILQLPSFQIDRQLRPFWRQVLVKNVLRPVTLDHVAPRRLLRGMQRKAISPEQQNVGPWAIRGQDLFAGIMGPRRVEHVHLSRVVPLVHRAMMRRVVQKVSHRNARGTEVRRERSGKHAQAGPEEELRVSRCSASASFNMLRNCACSFDGASKSRTDARFLIMRQ